jgi:hypothetical protein
MRSCTSTPPCRLHGGSGTALLHSSKKTQRVSITKLNWLTLLTKIIAVYFENHTKTRKLHSAGKMQLLNEKQAVIAMLQRADKIEKVLFGEQVTGIDISTETKGIKMPQPYQRQQYHKPLLH